MLAMKLFAVAAALAVLGTPALAAESLEGDVNRGAQRAESEANVILDESKKDLRVTKKDLAGCMEDWGPQTQMTKEEWEKSCRTTLEYFHDGR